MNSTQPVTLGFVGVGIIAEAVITALLTGPQAADLRVNLSPRSASRSAQLAERFDQARVAESNQDVVDQSDIVFLGVLPEQVEEVSSSLAFTEDHLVVSVVAGWAPSALAPHVAPAQKVCQMIPLTMISLGVGPIVIHPPVAEVQELFEGCGEIVPVAREADVLVFNCLSSVLSLFYEQQNTLITWATEQHGIDGQQATDYVTSMYHGLATQSLHAKFEEMAQLTRETETPGGLNEYVRVAMDESGMGSELTRHLEETYNTRRKG